MRASTTKIESVAIRYGLVTAASLIGYFLLMKLLGLAHNVELRVFNFLILAAGITLAIHKFKRIKMGDLAYLKGIGVGLLTAMVAAAIFAIFLLIYLWQLDPGFMELIQQRESFGQYLDPITVAFTIIIEGFGSGYLITFVVMQYLKRSHLQNPVVNSDL